MHGDPTCLWWCQSQQREQEEAKSMELAELGVMVPATTRVGDNGREGREPISLGPISGTDDCPQTQDRGDVSGQS